MHEQVLLAPGFLGTAASLSADIVLLLEIAMALVLLLGAFLARVRRYKSHALCQSTVVLLNLIVISFVMAPVFQARVLPKLPARLAKPYYLLSTAHAALGTSAEIVSLYILISAGTTVLPDRLRFRNYKVWMRSTLVLWWTTLLLGIATYVRWYVH